MRNVARLVAGLWLLSAAFAAAGEKGLSPEEALGKLRNLEGKWEAHVMTPDGPKTSVEYKVTAAGSTVMEVMFPGTDHEMISMFHLDGDRLIAKHYCSSGNQPMWVYQPNSSSPTKLSFGFVGGTNLDPAKDIHMHGGTMTLSGDDELENVWEQFEGVSKIEENRFYMKRQR